MSNRNYALARPRVVAELDPDAFDTASLRRRDTKLKGVGQIATSDLQVVRQLVAATHLPDQNDEVIIRNRLASEISYGLYESVGTWHSDTTDDYLVANACPTEFIVGGTLKSVRDLLGLKKNDRFDFRCIDSTLALQMVSAMKQYTDEELCSHFDFEIWSPEPYEVVETRASNIHRMPGFGDFSGVRSVAIYYQ